MKINRLRSVWGIAPGPNLDNWAQLFPDLKKQGYSMTPWTSIADHLHFIKWENADLI